MSVDVNVLLIADKTSAVAAIKACHNTITQSQHGEIIPGV